MRLGLSEPAAPRGYRSHRGLVRVGAVVGLVVAAMGWPVASAHAEPSSICGKVLTEDTVLSHGVYSCRGVGSGDGLIIGKDGIEYRVIRKHRRTFDEIEQVDVSTRWKTVNLELHFRGSPLTLVANVGTEPSAGAALALFPGSVPMTAKALALRSAAKA